VFLFVLCGLTIKSEKLKIAEMLTAGIFSLSLKRKRDRILAKQRGVAAEE
jgi:hypothetical protein